MLLVVNAKTKKLHVPITRSIVQTTVIVWSKLMVRTVRLTLPILENVRLKQTPPPPLMLPVLVMLLVLVLLNLLQKFVIRMVLTVRLSMLLVLALLVPLKIFVTY